LFDRCRSVLLSSYVVKDKAAVPVLDLVHICFPGHRDQFPLTMERARVIGSLDDLRPGVFTIIYDFETHGAVHVLNVVKIFATWTCGLQSPLLVVLPGTRVLLDPSPLSRRFAFHFQDQLTIFVDELNNFVHRYCHDYLLLAARNRSHIDQYRTMTPRLDWGIFPVTPQVDGRHP
jgi:hypothetical protein